MAFASLDWRRSTERSWLAQGHIFTVSCSMCNNSFNLSNPRIIGLKIQPAPSHFRNHWYGSRPLGPSSVISTEHSYRLFIRWYIIGTVCHRKKRGISYEDFPNKLPSTFKCCSQSWIGAVSIYSRNGARSVLCSCQFILCIWDRVR